MSLHLDAPNLGEKESAALKECIDSGYVSTVGPFVPHFEKEFARYVGTFRAVSTQSGTAAIHLALYEMGIGEGDEIIVPVTTFIATVNPLMYLKATPVFVDIDPYSWDIDPDQVRKAITKKTRAILPVHLFGNPCHMDELIRVSKEYGIPIVEDATESLGATFDGRHTGSFGSYGCFSFNGNKIITTGGGGMVVTDNQEAADHMKFLANQARVEGKGYYHTEIGFNYRMTNLEAALGLAQMSRLPDFLKKKRLLRSIYAEVFNRSSAIKLQEPHELASSSWWLTGIAVHKDNVDIDGFRKSLSSIDIPTRRMFCPIVDLPPYRSFCKQDYPVARDMYSRCLCLPSSTLNDPAEVEAAARRVLEIIES